MAHVQQSPSKDAIYFVEKEVQTPNSTSDSTSNETTSADASQSDAYNASTGEINWDCPCLNGMASGPCGDEFKGAFSCFVKSEEEVKGTECVQLFQTMQKCFQAFPEVYSDMLNDESLEE